MPGLFDNLFQGGGYGQGLLGDLAANFNPQLAPQMLAKHQIELQQQQQQALYNAFLAQKASPPEAQAAALDPEIRKTIAGRYFDTQPKFGVVSEDMLGGKQYGFINPAQQSIQMPQYVGANGQGGGGPGSPFLNPGTSQIDPNLVGEQYLQQFRPEIQQYIKGYMRGEITPTGQGRDKSMAELAKKIGPKYAAEVGLPWDENLFAQRRKMQMDLAGSGPNSMGGIMANGRSAFQHLGELGDAFVGLHNYSGSAVPGSALVAGIGNSIRNSELLRTQPQANAIAGTRPPLLKYGQESTKFYAGTGGSKEERTKPETNINVQHATSGEMAAFLKAERKLMLDRFEEKENQFGKIMGEDYLQRHPLRDALMQRSLDKIDEAIAKLEGGGTPASAPAGRPPLSSFFK